MKKALIILRVSDQLQEDRNSLEKQEEQALDYCKFKGYTVYKTLKTVVSGRKNDRADFIELENEVEKNSFDVLVFYELSRIARNAYFIHKLVHNLKQKEIEFESITENYLNSDSPTSKIMLGIMASQAEIESDMISKRVRNRMKFYASQGYHLFPAPLGYDLRDKILYPNEQAETVRQIFTDFVNGYSFNKLRDKYNLSVPGIKALLSNMTYLGKIRFGFEGKNASTGKRVTNLPGEVFEGKHEAIIDLEIFELAQIISKERCRKKLKIHTNKNILTGIIRHNNDRMFGRRGSDDYRYYACSVCQKSISAKKIEKIVIDSLIEYAKTLVFLDKKKVKKTKDKNVDNNKKIVELNEKKNRIIETYSDGFISRENYLKKVKEIENEIQALSIPISAEKEDESNLKESLLNDIFDIANKDDVEKKQIIHLFIEKITFTDDRDVEIIFKF